MRWDIFGGSKLSTSKEKMLGLMAMKSASDIVEKESDSKSWIKSSL